MLILAEGPAHGYGIVQSASDRFGREAQLDPANLYRSVLRLMRDDLVRDARDAPDDGSSQRRYFELTAGGKAVVAAEAERLARLTDAARSMALIPTEGG